MTFMNGDPSDECYGDNCKGCDQYNRCGYIRVSNPFGDRLPACGGTGIQDDAA